MSKTKTTYIYLTRIIKNKAIFISKIAKEKEYDVRK